MSLVMAAISKRSRSRLHSQSINAVLPEPTGPPTPTRNGPFTLTMAAPHENGRNVIEVTYFFRCHASYHRLMSLAAPQLANQIATMIAKSAIPMETTLRALTRGELV